MRSSLVTLILISVWAMPAYGQIDEYARDQAEIESTFDDILSRSDYRHLFQKETESKESGEMPEWLENFLKWLFGDGDEERTQVETRARGIGGGLFYLAWMILIVVVLVLLIHLFRGIKFDQSRDAAPLALDQEAITPSTPPGDLPVNEYEQRAIVSAKRGDFRSAIRELVLGAMSWTERAELIRYRRGLTNRDYVRALWSDELRRDALLEIVSDFERVFYGRREADKEMFESCLADFRQSFIREGEYASVAN